MKLEGRVAAVTGAASGIGRGLASALARKGCDLALADVDESGLAVVAGEVQALGRKVSIHRVDVREEAAVRAFADAVIAEHGRVHLVVNNAGVTAAGTFEEVPLDDFRWVVDVNFWGVVYGCHAFLPHLRRQDTGHIVNISSLFGLVGVPGQTAYCATKFAVRGFSESLWTEVSADGIGVTCVHPGGIQTHIVRSARMVDESEREESIAGFERLARMSPSRAAEQIVAAVEDDRMRLRITLESHVGDWLKRLAPVASQRLLRWSWLRRDRKLP